MTDYDTLALVVKGDKFHAAGAAAFFGVPFAFVRETRDGTIGLAPASAERAVAEWFTSDVRPPFPAGALLHYARRSIGPTFLETVATKGAQ